MKAATIRQAWMNKIISDPYEQLPRLEVEFHYDLARKEEDSFWLQINFYDEKQEGFDTDLSGCLVEATLKRVKGEKVNDLMQWQELTEAQQFLEVSPQQVINAVDHLLSQILPALRKRKLPTAPERWRAT